MYVLDNKNWDFPRLSVYQTAHYIGCQKLHTVGGNLRHDIVYIRLEDCLHMPGGLGGQKLRVIWPSW